MDERKGALQPPLILMHAHRHNVGIHILCDQYGQSSCLHLLTDDVQAIVLWLFC